ncbi:MAG: ABC transporter transmembrane domain-containing protein [Pseudomonadota bacterium]
MAGSPIGSARGVARLGHLNMIWRFVRRYPLHLSAGIVALLLAAATTLAIPLALKQVVDKGFGAPEASAAGEVPSLVQGMMDALLARSGLSAVDFYFQVLMGLAIALGVFTATRFYFVTWIGERVVADIRVAVHSHLLSFSPEFFEENRPSEISSRLTADTTLIQSVVGSSASIALRNLITGIGGMAVLAVLSPRLMGMMGAVIPLVVLPIVILGRRVRSLSRSSQDRIADIGAMADEVLGALRIVQAFTQESNERGRFASAVERAFTAAKRRIFMRAVMTVIVITLIFGGITALLWQSVNAVARGDISGGTIAAFVLISGLVAGALGALTEVYGDVMRAAGAAGRLAELMNAEAKIKAPATPRPLPEPPQGRVVFEKVTFRYPSKPHMAALNDFSLAVAPGETVALVGPSGAGKSTIFQLLQRFYDPQAGRIFIDNVALPEAEPRAVRARMALVPQETVIFAATAYENILYGRPDASEEEVWAAARAAHADDFIRELPQGMDSFLGEAGVRLSGGQRQRLAIARAILRDAPILLLDEATSALDAQSERLVQAALNKLMEGRTTLVIAHRLATVLKADRIVVMDGGRTVAEGRHEDLMAREGLYARLAALQFDMAAAQ